MEAIKLDYNVEERKAIVVIPAYKPIQILVSIVEQLNNEGFFVIVVDDGSGEEYREIFEKVSHYAYILRHDVNKGKGEALKTAYRYILKFISDGYGLNYTSVITADADGQHSIKDIIRLCDVLNTEDNLVESNVHNKSRKLILGCREFTGKVPLRSKIGNYFTRMIFANTTKVNVTDTQTGLRGFNNNLLEEMINIEGSRYEYEMNVLMWATNHDVDIQEEKIATIYDCDDNPSHFRPLVDSVRIYSNIIKFALSSFTSFLIDYALVMLFAYSFGFAGEKASLIISVVLARVFSSMYNYMINKKVVFNDNRKGVTSLVQYYSLAVVILLCNISLMYLFKIIIGIRLAFAKLIVEAILFIFSYIIQKKIIFRKNEDNEER